MKCWLIHQSVPRGPAATTPPARPELVFQHGMTAPHTARELRAAPADHFVPVDDRDGVAVAQYLCTAADAWAAAETEETADRARERVRSLRRLERGAVVALHDAVQDGLGEWGLVDRGWGGVEHLPAACL